MTLREFVQQDVDIDVYDDVCEELGIAFVGPQEFTEDGMKEFEDIMDFDVEINEHSYFGYPAAIVHVDDEDEKVWKHRIKRIKLFFESAAGYCSVEEYEKWFGDV